MIKLKIIGDAFIYSMQKTFDNFGLYCLSILASIGVVIMGTILFLGSYVLIIAHQIPAFQELLRLFFAGKAITNVGGKIASTEQAIAMSKTIFASFTPLLILLGLILFIFFSMVLVAILAGHINMLLNVYDNGRGSISDFFAAFIFSPGLYLINILGILMAAAPFLLFAPLIYFAVTQPLMRILIIIIASMGAMLIGSRFYLAQYFYVDTEKTIAQSLAASWFTTKDAWLATVLLILLSAIFSLNTTLLLIAQFPFVLMVIYVYRSLHFSGANCETSHDSH